MLAACLGHVVGLTRRLDDASRSDISSWAPAQRSPRRGGAQLAAAALALARRHCMLRARSHRRLRQGRLLSKGSRLSGYRDALRTMRGRRKSGLTRTVAHTSSRWERAEAASRRRSARCPAPPRSRPPARLSAASFTAARVACVLLTAAGGEDPRRCGAAVFVTPALR